MSQYKNFTVAIVGAGGIGRAVGLLLAEYADFNVNLYLGDRDLKIAEDAANWINVGNTRSVVAEGFLFSERYENEANNIFFNADIVLDCLPGSQAPRIGSIAKQYGLHYVNLTEYVNETNQIVELARDAKTGFVLQTGLAPGFINILANSLYQDFVKSYHNEKVEYIGMKVGALTENAEAPHFYGFTWSPIGVATEYLKDAYVIQDFKKTTVPSLSDLNPIVINGSHYEEDFTSGGAADLPDAFSGIAKKLDYKTLRYPGHYNWVKKVLTETPSGSNPVEFLEKKMLSDVPSTEKDVVVIYAVVKGFDQSGCLRSVEKAFKIEPSLVGNVTLRAIQSTTAAPMAECARMLLLGNKKGVILQSELDTATFLNGPFVQGIYYRKEGIGKKQHSTEIAAIA
jgi:saccharopine dehydrogenase-like NADP-dependent oxidoreductase